MEFIFSKVVANGEPMYKYIGQSGLIDNKKLPITYLYDDGAHVRLNTGGEEFGIVYTDWDSEDEYYLYPDDLISLWQYDEFVAISHMAGERLYKIRMLEKWHGIQMVIV
jgi:hypothetical protein